MKVYHGSDTPVSVVDLQKCKPNRDFGRGFYVTKLRSQAESWAVNVSRKRKTQGVVSEFEYNESDFTRYVCKIRHFDDYNEEWLDFVAMNRDESNPKPAHDYDIVEGPVADDRITRNITKYLNGKISKADFLEMLKHSEPNHQICFCTINSLQMLKYVENPQDIEYELSEIGEPLLEQLMLHSGLDAGKAADAFYSSQTFARLADESTGLYRQPWQEIYEMLKSELKM